MNEIALIIIVVGLAYISGQLNALVRDIHEIADLIRNDRTNGDPIEYHLKNLVYTNREIFHAVRAKGVGENISDTLISINDTLGYLKHEWDKERGYI